MREIFESVKNNMVLAIEPTFEEFSDWFRTESTANENDEEEVKEAVEMFLEDFTEKAVKTAMLSEATHRYCTWDNVQKFEADGRYICIGQTPEEHVSGFEFEDDEERKRYISEFCREVKHGCADFCIRIKIKGGLSSLFFNALNIKFL